MVPIIPNPPINIENIFNSTSPLDEDFSPSPSNEIPLSEIPNKPSNRLCILATSPPVISINSFKSVKIKVIMDIVAIDAIILTILYPLKNIKYDKINKYANFEPLKTKSKMSQKRYFSDPCPFIL